MMLYMFYLPLRLCIMWPQSPYHLYSQSVRECRVTYLPYILNRYDKLLAIYFPGYSLCIIKHTSPTRKVFLQLRQLFVRFLPPKRFAIDGIPVFQHLNYHEPLRAAKNVGSVSMYRIHVDIEFSPIHMLVSLLGCIPMWFTLPPVNEVIPLVG